MSPSGKTVSRLLGLLYGAAAAPEEWPAFLEALADESRAKSAVFVLVDPQNRCSLAVNPGFDSGSQRSYVDYYYRHDILLDRFVAACKDHGSWIGTSQTVIPDAEYHRSLVFNEFAVPLGHVHQAGAMLDRLDGGLEGGLAMHRGAESEPFGQDSVDLLAMLMPHLKRAINTHRTLSLARVQTAGLRHSLEALDLAILSLDHEGRVLRLSACAQTILSQGHGIRVEGGFLRAAHPAEDARLSAMISGATATGMGKVEEFAVRTATDSAPEASRNMFWTPCPGGAMIVTRIPPARPLQVVVSPFHSGEAMMHDRPAALVFLSDPDVRPASRSALLSALYRLTPTECRLADYLTQGSDLSMAAARLHMTTETARFHLKSIFRKTGAKRQSDLIRMVLGLPGSWIKAS